jgi:hypothetical protein
MMTGKNRFYAGIHGALPGDCVVIFICPMNTPQIGGLRLMRGSSTMSNSHWPIPALSECDDVVVFCHFYRERKIHL